MTQEAHVGDGWPLSLQYRALATAAALARLGYTIERATHAAHALRLLCRRDQLALLGASSASTDPAARSQVAKASHGPPVKFRRLQAVGHALPFDGHLVCLDGVPTAEQALNAGVACAFGFVGMPPALPPLPGIVPLPIPVAAQALQPAQNQRRRGIAFVVVHPRRCAKARQAAMDGLGKGAVTTFDPYCADDAPHERVVGPCGPADRIALWRRSEAVLLSTRGGCDEDSFAREARAAVVR